MREDLKELYKTKINKVVQDRSIFFLNGFFSVLANMNDLDSFEKCSLMSAIIGQSLGDIARMKIESELSTVQHLNNEPLEAFICSMNYKMLEMLIGDLEAIKSDMWEKQKIFRNDEREKA